MKNKPNQNTKFYQLKAKQTLPQLRSRRKVQNYSTQQSGLVKERIDFKYGFQDYLKMALSKLIPHPGIIIDPQEGLIYGERDECVKLKRKIQKEFTSKKYKKIQFKTSVDLDQIQYQLDPKYQATIFRVGYIERALSSLSLYDTLGNSCRKFRETVKNNRMIILKVKADYESQCMQKIEQILKKHDQGTKKKQQQHQSSSLTNHQRQEDEYEYEQIVEEDVNYYQMKEQHTNKPQPILQELNEIDDSEFNLTQTNSSQFMDQQQDIPSSDYQHRFNRSFM